MGRDIYHTRKRANEGAILMLTDPATGEETGDWLRVLGPDSDQIRRQLFEKERATQERLAEADEGVEEAPPTGVKERERRLARMRQEMLKDAPEEIRADAASRVVGWGGPNFPDPCTPEAVAELFAEAPQLADAVYVAVTSRARFLALAVSISSPTPKPTSDSASP